MKYPKQNLKWLPKFIDETEELILALPKLNSIKTYYSNVGVVLRDTLNLPEQGNRFIKLGTIYNQESIDSELNQDDLENPSGKCFIGMKDVLQRVNQLKLDWEENQNDIPSHMKYLLLVLQGVAQPPLRRTTCGEMKIIHTLKDNNGKDNFVFIPKDNNGVPRYIINDDKVKGKKDSDRLKNLELTREATKIIKESINILPRKYLLVQLNSSLKPMSKQSYSQALANLFPDSSCKITQNV